ncbi:MAG: hypothetical protein QOG69_544 [Actinomycetota bacterium]|nr:hypothetical protein [Actinomycetota bacterium]
MPTSRRVFAAAHVAAVDAETIDWEATMDFRDHLWAHGFAVAEAMDTAQRGMGLNWSQTQELIARTAKRAASVGGGLACGAGTDQLSSGVGHSLGAITDAYREQIEVVQTSGATVILMASRALAASAISGRDYLSVYTALLRDVDQPAILHWLGDAFDPALRGYWGAANSNAAADVVIELIARAGDRIDGVKVSLLDAEFEIALRQRLPAGVRLYTGDDFDYARLIRGDGMRHSDALLGAFAAITEPAAEALQALDAGDLERYDAVMYATLPLSRKVFETPTFNYKVGIAFLAWLNGFQPQFRMIGDLQGQRSRAHLVEVFRLAAGAGALRDPELSIERMTQFLAERSDEAVLA